MCSGQREWVDKDNSLIIENELGSEWEWARLGKPRKNITHKEKKKQFRSVCQKKNKKQALRNEVRLKAQKCMLKSGAKMEPVQVMGESPGLKIPVAWLSALEGK